MLELKLYSAKIIAINIPRVQSNVLPFGVTRQTMERVSRLLHPVTIPTYRILSLDGGGVRGIVEAVWLRELAKRLDRPLHSYFDLITGTSIGSILACSVSMDLDMEDTVQIFLTRIGKIFPSPLSMIWSKLLRIRFYQLGPPLYDGKGLETLLQEIFGDARFTVDYLKTPVLLPTYNTGELTPEYIRSNQPEYAENHVWEICRAACSAPFFFPPYTIQRDGSPHTMIDGALFSNNPTGCALAEAQRIHRSLNVRPVNYLVASFGTVSVNSAPLSSVHMGFRTFEWIRWVLYTIFASNTKDANHKVLQAIGEDNFFRFQVGLPKGMDRIDNADPDNLHSLMQLAQDYLTSDEGSMLLDKLVERLTTPDHPIPN